jgi:hypothetical protein
MVEQLTRIAADAAGDPTLASRTWVLLTEAPDGGWGLDGHANTNEELVAHCRPSWRAGYCGDACVARGHGPLSRTRLAASRRAAALRWRAARSSLVMAGSWSCWTPPAPSTLTSDKVTS